MKIMKKNRALLLLVTSFATSHSVEYITNGVQNFIEQKPKVAYSIAAATGLGIAGTINHKFPQVRQGIFSGVKSTAKGIGHTAQWLWNSKTALAASGLIRAATYQLATSNDELVQKAVLVPAGLSLGYLAKEQINVFANWFTKSKIKPRRADWEKELYLLDFDNETLDSFDTWVNAFGVAQDSGDIAVFNTFIANQVCDIFLAKNLILSVDKDARQTTREFQRQETLKVIEKHLEKSAARIKELDRSTGVIKSLAKEFAIDTSLDAIAKDLTKYDALRLYEDFITTDGYNTSNNLSRVLHVHTDGVNQLPSIQGHSWNSKVSLEWALIKEYATITLIRNIIRTATV